MWGNERGTFMYIIDGGHMKNNTGAGLDQERIEIKQTEVSDKQPQGRGIGVEL